MPGVHDRAQGLPVLPTHSVKSGLDALDLFDDVLGAFARYLWEVRAEGGKLGRLDIAQGADIWQILAQNFDRLLASRPPVVTAPPPGGSSSGSR